MGADLVLRDTWWRQLEVRGCHWSSWVAVGGSRWPVKSLENTPRIATLEIGHGVFWPS